LLTRKVSAFPNPTLSPSNGTSSLRTKDLLRPRSEWLVRLTMVGVFQRTVPGLSSGTPRLPIKVSQWLGSL
ncbi:hypothetical protein BGZ91_008949, partial [Linnemannia elongata]